MNLFGRCLLAFAAVLLPSAVFGGTVFHRVDISGHANFSWNGSADLPGAPIGPVTLGGVPFSIKSNSKGFQAWSSYIAAKLGAGTMTLRLRQNVYGVRTVYTLINS